MPSSCVRLFVLRLCVMALNSLLCAHVPLRNCSLTHSLRLCVKVYLSQAGVLSEWLNVWSCKQCHHSPFQLWDMTVDKTSVEHNESPCDSRETGIHMCIMCICLQCFMSRVKMCIVWTSAMTDTVGGRNTADAAGRAAARPGAAPQVVHVWQERWLTEVYQAGRLWYRPRNWQRLVLLLFHFSLVMYRPYKILCGRKCGGWVPWLKHYSGARCCICRVDLQEANKCALQ